MHSLSTRLHWAPLIRRYNHVLRSNLKRSSTVSDPLTVLSNNRWVHLHRGILWTRLLWGRRVTRPFVASQHPTQPLALTSRIHKRWVSAVIITDSKKRRFYQKVPPNFNHSLFPLHFSNFEIVQVPHYKAIHLPTVLFFASANVTLNLWKNWQIRFVLQETEEAFLIIWVQGGKVGRMHLRCSPPATVPRGLDRPSVRPRTKRGWNGALTFVRFERLIGFVNYERKLWHRPRSIDLLWITLREE